MKTKLLFIRSVLFGIDLIENEQQILKKHKKNLQARKTRIIKKGDEGNPWKLIHIKSDIAICKEDINELNEIKKKVESIRRVFE